MTDDTPIGKHPECAPFEDRLHDWVDRELDRDEATDVAKHVDSCARCTEIVRSVQNLKALLRTKATEVSVPARLESRVREAIALETLHSKKKRAKITPLSAARKRWIAAAAVLILTIPALVIYLTTPDLHAQITQAALDSHTRSLSGESMPRYHCMSQEEAESSLSDVLKLDVKLPEFAEGRVCVKGVGFETHSGVKVGKVFYKLDDKDFSLFIVPSNMRGGKALCCCYQNSRLNIFCSNEGGYCFTYVTELDAEKFRTEVLVPALKRAIQFPKAHRFKATHPEETLDG